MNAPVPGTAHVRDALASVALQVRFEDLPADVVRQAKHLVIDTLGCAFGGLSEAPARAVRALVEDLGGTAEATVIGSRARTSCTMATLANGTALRALDANDYYFGRDPAHASGNLAAVLAVGERAGASGRDVLAAFVAAFEVQLRLCDHAGEPNLWDRGWHHATNMSLASAAAAGKLLGLDRSGIAEALSIAGTHGNILTESMRGRMASIKATIEAVAAKGGVEAALLAKYGLTGPATIFEGDYGWGRAVAGGIDVDALCAPLDGDFAILRTRIKAFAAFAPAQGLIQAALDVRATHTPAPAEIDAIEGRFPDQIFKWPTSDDQKALPGNRETADHSPAYLIAVALLDGACGAAQFTPERLSGSDVRALMEKITMRPDADLTANYRHATGAAVQVRMQDGRRFEKVVPIPPGHPENRLDAAGIERKFRALAEAAIGSRHADRVLEAVDRLDRMGDLRTLTGLLAL